MCTRSFLVEGRRRWLRSKRKRTRAWEWEKKEWMQNAKWKVRVKEERKERRIRKKKKEVGIAERKNMEGEQFNFFYGGQTWTFPHWHGQVEWSTKHFDISFLH